MIVKSGPVMDISLESSPCRLSLSAFLEFITTLLIPVFRPIGETYPTELESALKVTTSHVITAAVLLDGSLAFGTLLCVGEDPIGGLAVDLLSGLSQTLLVPTPEYITTGGFVPSFTAEEAEDGTTFTLNGNKFDVILHFNGSETVGCRTPSQEPI